jgi:hypothetical protein
MAALGAGGADWQAASSARVVAASVVRMYIENLL